jgi:uncharacterized protein (DUF697 family)
MDPINLASLVKAAMDEAIRERGHVNVVIVGKTGVGKSTLINAVFQGRYAQTGQGRPVTTDTREITKEGIPLTIFDTRGLEMKDYQVIVDDLEQLVVERQREKDPNKHIHVAWVCVQEPGRRVEDGEVALHRMLAKHMPVIGVVTKSTSDMGFRAEVQRLLPQCQNLVRVRALEEVLDDGHRLETMGLKDLVTLTMECVPEGHRRAFVAAQKASLRLKVNRSHACVAGGAAAAAAAGASPIPFSDAFVLVPIQVSMLAGISACFGLHLSKAFLATLVSSVAGTTVTTFAGRALIANVLKFIPGVGTAVGAAINATMAVTLTTTLGEVYIVTLRALFEESKGEPPSSEEVTARFKSVMAARQAR